MMGGDFAPAETVKAVSLFLSSNKDVTILELIGDCSRLDGIAESDRVSILHASEMIDMHDSPTRALRDKPRSSIAIGLQRLASGDIDAFISAGNTGAMLVGSLFSIRPLEGVLRPAIPTLFPKTNGKAGLIVDVGLNADCKPEHLNQFAIMGSVYAQLILGIDNPRVALINVGEEEGKGNLLTQSAYPLLRENRHIHFVGNIEGRHLLLDKADVMVCEGFTGNVILKFAESLYEVARNRGLQDEYFDRFNFENYGGTPILGVSKPIIIGHGISHARAFVNMIHLAQQILEKNVMEKMKEELQS